jgi:HCOMODA/2-hydroxy-3-carboxy-muconic semialdehyde decarboxylase
MSPLDSVVEDLVAANRILAHEGMVDGYGHVSARHPHRPDRFLLSQARTPQCIEPDDIMEYALDGVPVDPQGRSSYLERFIHGAIYEARPDVHAVVHSHSHAVIPFGVGGETIRPLTNVCAMIGAEVPIWDSRHRFGDTNLLVSDMTMGRDLAARLGSGTTALLRGHGSVAAERTVRRTAFIAIALQVNAELQMKCTRYDDVVFLSPGEIEQSIIMNANPKPRQGLDRIWEYYCYRAGMPYRPGV